MYGTNIMRSFAAIGRHFPFPIDASTQEHPPITDNVNQGEMTEMFIESHMPLLKKQREIFNILVQDRREYHRTLQNRGRKQKTFAVGDLVSVRVEVQTSDRHGPGKSQLQVRGPYRVLDALSDNTYWIQRIPFDADSIRKPGVAYKESAVRMEKLPSKLAMHSHAGGIDTNWATFRHAFVPAPLQKNLDITSFGNFERSDDPEYAYQRIDELWEELGREDAGRPELHVIARDPVPAVAPTRAPPQPAIVQPKPPPSEAIQRRQLAKRLEESKDKMCFVWHRRTANQSKRWFLAEALYEDFRDEQKLLHTGVVTFRFYIRHYADSRKYPIEECRYWPEVHELLPSDIFGKLLCLSPDKIAAHIDKYDRNYAKGRTKLRYSLYDHELQACDHIITGPFNWATRQQIDKPRWRIPATIWNRLRRDAPGKGVDTTDFGQIIPVKLAAGQFLS